MISCCGERKRKREGDGVSSSERTEREEETVEEMNLGRKLEDVRLDSSKEAEGRRRKDDESLQGERKRASRDVTH